MEFVKYNNCIAIRFTKIPEYIIDKKCLRAVVNVELCDGDSVNATFLIRQNSHGQYRVAEILIDKDTPKGYIEELASAWWFVFSVKEKNRKMPPIVACWDMEDYQIYECLPPTDKKWKTAGQQLAELKKQSESDGKGSLGQ